MSPTPSVAGDGSIAHQIFARQQADVLHSPVSFELMSAAVRLPCGHALDHQDVVVLHRAGMPRCVLCQHPLPDEDALQPCYLLRQAVRTFADHFDQHVEHADPAVLARYHRACAQAPVTARLAYLPPAPAQPASPGRQEQGGRGPGPAPTALEAGPGCIYRDFPQLFASLQQVPGASQRAGVGGGVAAAKSPEAADAVQQPTAAFCRPRPPAATVAAGRGSVGPISLPALNPSPKAAGGRSEPSDEGMALCPPPARPRPVACQATAASPAEAPPYAIADRLRRQLKQACEHLRAQPSFPYLTQSIEILCDQLRSVGTDTVQGQAHLALDLTDKLMSGAYASARSLLVERIEQMRTLPPGSPTHRQRALLAYLRQMLRTHPEGRQVAARNDLYRFLDWSQLSPSSPINAISQPDTPRRAADR